MSDAVQLQGIAQVAITVDRLEDSVEFYKRLGLSVLFQTPRMAMLACGATRVLLGTREPGQPEQAIYLYFRVADIRAAYAGLVSGGVRVRDAPHMVGRFQENEVWLATFFDPDGVLHHLTSEVPGKAPASG